MGPRGDAAGPGARHQAVLRWSGQPERRQDEWAARRARLVLDEHHRCGPGRAALRLPEGLRQLGDGRRGLAGDPLSLIRKIEIGSRPVRRCVRLPSRFVECRR
ncbi:hypothetical protein CURTO8I2_120063 [Curtobacterium sp. 8I-2]|nr:hypothetical protein CURTO8I2_120063 [Curtobacterium sp. 8I-2]